MIVAELAIILEHVDPTLPIILGGDHRATHVYEVAHHHAGRLRAYGFASPANLHIEGGYRATGWWEPECDFSLLGRFRRSAELERRLDALRP